MAKRFKNKTQTSPINFLDLLSLQVIDQKILLLLRQYLFRRRVTVLFTSTIIVLISLNTLFLAVHLYDCRMFDLCSMDDEESKPFFFWILIGLNLTLSTVLVFVVLHLKHCKQYYAENLLKLTTKALKPDRPASSQSSANSQTFSNCLASSDQHRKSPKFSKVFSKDFDVPSISVVHFETNADLKPNNLNKRTCYDNLTFESDPGIELNEMKGQDLPTQAGTKESYS